VYEVGGGSCREYITVHHCGSAAGKYLPPFILYKGKNLLSKYTVGGPDGAVYGISSSGWMERPNFASWFEKVFVAGVADQLKNGNVILIFDGHLSHINLPLLKTAKEKGIHVVCLPPNTTHALQPLDVGVFGPMKARWRQILKQHKIQTQASRVDRMLLPTLLNQLYLEEPMQFQIGSLLHLFQQKNHKLKSSLKML
jgi:hypothetical protein